MTKQLNSNFKSSLGRIHPVLVLVLMIFSFKGFSQAPANDEICGAVPISCGPAVAGTTVGANNLGTHEFVSPFNASCGGYTQFTPAVWYVFDGTGDIATFSLCGSAVFNDSELAVYSGTTCSNASCLGANDDNGPSCIGIPSQASISIPTVLGTKYYVKVFSWNQLTPNFNFSLSVTCTPPPTPPGNDQICGALQMQCSLNNVYSSQTTTAATIGGYGEIGGLGACSGQSQNTPAVWYKVLGTGQTMTLDLCQNSPFDSQIAVYSSANGSCPDPVLNPLTCVTANDDFGPSCATLQASVSFQSQNNVWYWVKVWRWSWIYNPNLAMGSFEIRLNCSGGPPNDPCSGATLVGVPYNSGIVSAASATNDPAGTVPTSFTNIFGVSTSVCGNVTANLNNTLWYRVIGDGTSYTASTISSSTNFDTEIQVFTGSCGALVGVACSNSSSAGQPCSNPYFEDVTWCTQAGQTYYVMVGSEFSNCSNSNFNLSISSSAVPSTAILYNNDMVWRGGAGTGSVKNTVYPYVYDGGEDWNNYQNWYVYDSLNNSFDPAVSGQLPSPTTNVFIPKLGGCNTKFPMIYNGTSAFAKNITIMKDARLAFASCNACPSSSGSLEVKGDLFVSGQLSGGVGSSYTQGVATSPGLNYGTGVVKFTGTNNQNITYAEMTNPAPPSMPAPINGIVNIYDLEINISNSSIPNIGLILGIPVHVFRDLKMQSGNILTTSTNFLALGWFASCPLLQTATYPLLATNAYGSSGNPLVSTVNWTTGSIVGPMFRYIRANTNVSTENSLYPVGGMFNGNITNRNASLQWVAKTNSTGFLRARYITGSVPFTTGMPLTDLTPTSVNLTTIGTEGYWEIHPYQNFTNAYQNNFPTLAPAYNLFLRGNQYPSISANYATSRIIKAPGAPPGAPTLIPPFEWQLNGTHNTITGQSTDFTVSRNGMSTFSIFAIAVPNLPLASEFLGANYVCNDGGVDFSWSSASEHNSDHYTIETSEDGENWTVNAEHASVGNNTERTDYRIALPQPNGDLYYVRLTEHDADGTETQLGIFAVSCSGKGSIFTYPNPSSDEFILSISDDDFIGEADVAITNAMGETIVEFKGIEINNGTNNYSIDMKNSKPGVYFIRIIKGDHSQVVRHVVH